MLPSFPLHFVSNEEKEHSFVNNGVFGRVRKTSFSRLLVDVLLFACGLFGWEVGGCDTANRVRFPQPGYREETFRCGGVGQACRGGGIHFLVCLLAFDTFFDVSLGIRRSRERWSKRGRNTSCTSMFSTSACLLRYRLWIHLWLLWEEDCPLPLNLASAAMHSGGLVVM